VDVPRVGQGDGTYPGGLCGGIWLSMGPSWTRYTAGILVLRHSLK